jgi:hypothetical protein
MGLTSAWSIVWAWTWTKANSWRSESSNWSLILIKPLKLELDPEGVGLFVQSFSLVVRSYSSSFCDCFRFLLKIFVALHILSASVGRSVDIMSWFVSEERGRWRGLPLPVSDGVICKLASYRLTGAVIFLSSFSPLTVGNDGVFIEQFNSICAS